MNWFLNLHIYISICVCQLSIIVCIHGCWRLIELGHVSDSESAFEYTAETPSGV